MITVHKDVNKIFVYKPNILRSIRSQEYCIINFTNIVKLHIVKSQKTQNKIFPTMLRKNSFKRKLY